MSINLYSDGFPKENLKWPLLFSMGIMVIFKSNFKTVQKPVLPISLATWLQWCCV